MRRQSVFTSTKVIVAAAASTVEGTALLAKDVVDYARSELSATSKLAGLENIMEFTNEKTSGLRAMFKELAELEAQPQSVLRDMEIELIKAAIDQVAAYQ